MLSACSLLRVRPDCLHHRDLTPTPRETTNHTLVHGVSHVTVLSEQCSPTHTPTPWDAHACARRAARLPATACFYSNVTSTCEHRRSHSPNTPYVRAPQVTPSGDSDRRKSPSQWSTTHSLSVCLEDNPQDWIIRITTGMGALGAPGTDIRCTCVRPTRRSVAWARRARTACSHSGHRTVGWALFATSNTSESLEE